MEREEVGGEMKIWITSTDAMDKVPMLNGPHAGVRIYTNIPDRPFDPREPDREYIIVCRKYMNKLLHDQGIRLPKHGSDEVICIEDVGLYKDSKDIDVLSLRGLKESK
jgi:hypothetical protein